MKKQLLILLLLALTFSCKSRKGYTKKTKHSTTKTTATSNKAKQIVRYAKTFTGTPYKYGGMTKKGMDCSGLIHISFKANNIVIPRTTTTQSTEGKWIDVKHIEVGDLVFFATKKNSRKITHVGLVTALKNDSFEFIHASSSRGVMISSLKNRYWYLAYVQARRLL